MRNSKIQFSAKSDGCVLYCEFKRDDSGAPCNLELLSSDTVYQLFICLPASQIDTLQNITIAVCSHMQIENGPILLLVLVSVVHITFPHTFVCKGKVLFLAIFVNKLH